MNIEAGPDRQTDRVRLPPGGFQMKASMLVAPRKFEIREIPDPKPVEGQVLVKVKCVGVCGTDVAVYRG